MLIVLIVLYVVLTCSMGGVVWSAIEMHKTAKAGQKKTILAAVAGEIPAHKVKSGSPRDYPVPLSDIFENMDEFGKI